MKIIITTDSALDIPEDMIKEHGIKTIPIMFEIDGKLIADGEITPEELIKKFYENKKWAIRTTPATTDEYYCFFTPFAYMGYHVIHLSMGQSFSQCYQNALEAAKSFEHIHVVDTRSVTGGAVPFVLKIIQMQEYGKTTGEIAEYLQNEFWKKVHLSALLNTIDFVHIGEGSNQLKNDISSFLMNLFKRKVSVSLDFSIRSDAFAVDRHFKGDYETAVKEYIRYTFSDTSNAEKTAVITYTSGTKESLLKQCAETVKKEGFEDVKIVKASCGITSHFGYGCILLCWYEK